MIWLFVVAGLFCAPSKALGNPAGAWFLDHLALDVAAVTAWRVAWTDDRNPGFNMLGGGGELHLGMEFDSGFGFLLGTRAVFGPKRSTLGGDTHADVAGHALLLFRVTDWVRISAGPTAGRLWQVDTRSDAAAYADAPSIGGLLRFGIDVYPRQSNVLKAIAFWLRIQFDGHPGKSESTLPSTSLSMSGSLGIRL